jgi:hypothetical protein
VLQGHVTEAGARVRRLTLVDLGDHWTHEVFTEDPERGGPQPYRRTLLALADERFGRGPQFDRAREDRYLELYGICPTLRVHRERLRDEARHTCHDAVDDAPLGALTETPQPYAVEEHRRRVRAVAYLTRQLESVRRRRRLASIDALAEDPTYGRPLRQLRELEAYVRAIAAAQAHLRCEGFLHRRAETGVFDAWTADAVRLYQRRHMIVSIGGRLDASTRRAMAMDSRELDFLGLLRTLRERVVAATGLIEDGTAANEYGTVVGRTIDLDDEFQSAARQLGAMPNGAPDLISAATDAAARALGWTDPVAARAWLDTYAAEPAATRWVALPLPPPPPWHVDPMDLRAEIDRGDVWYDFPYSSDGRPRGQPVQRRPTLVLYVRHEGREIPLIRWNTTIGGWKAEINPADGRVGLRYKESDVGPRIWRDVVATPAWIPPEGTPVEELVRRHEGEWVVNRDLTGPGYASAYGLVMMIHHQLGDRNGTTDLLDNQIRTHGSVSYHSILRGTSHGCHRLFNHLAVRLASFLLRHRPHVRHGRIATALERELVHEGQTLRLEIDNRGYLFELTPPVPVEVLRGRIRGEAQRPLQGFFPLPEELAARARAELNTE